MKICNQESALIQISRINSHHLGGIPSSSKLWIWFKMVVTDSVSRHSDDIWSITARIQQGFQLSEWTAWLHHTFGPQRPPEDANTHLLWRNVPSSRDKGEECVKCKDYKAHKDLSLLEQFSTGMRHRTNRATKISGLDDQIQREAQPTQRNKSKLDLKKTQQNF